MANPLYYWENMTLEPDEESAAFALMSNRVELGHVFTEDGETWGAFLGDSTATTEVGRFRTRAAAKRCLIQSAKDKKHG